MIPLSHSLILGCSLFIIGFLGTIIRRELIFTSFSLSIMNASLCYILFTVGLYNNADDGTLNISITLLSFFLQFSLTSALLIAQFHKKQQKKMHTKSDKETAV